MRIAPLLILGLITLNPKTGNAQGCSDAGVCTAGPIGELAIGDSTSMQDDLRHFARLGFSIAGGEQGTTIMHVVPELGFGIADRLGVQLKVPYVSASGKLGDNRGVGDPTITASYAIVKERDRRIDGVVGIKLNANKADASTTEGLSLPMPYQTSLGTTDLLLGVNYRWGRINAALAYQHVLVNNNENGFAGPAGLDSLDALGYFPSARLVRANDAVARIQYAFPIGKLVVQPGLLGIVHLAEDERSPTDMESDRVAIEGSDGLTLNLTIDARYRLTDALAIEAAYGSPLVVREVRPDGLTRSYVMTIGLRYAF